MKISLLCVCHALVRRVFAALLLCLSLVPATAGPHAVKKVIHQYALTSANDFAQRDPQDWRLMASNDGGNNWATLDVRRGEVFHARQERKLYRISNTIAYEAYRLEIDRIRDPVTASSVQLAEIELMGLTEDDSSPTPIFTDVITAQGDNPPSETVASLFDGRVETKWLDFAPNPLSRASWIQWRYMPDDQAVATNISQLLALRARSAGAIHVNLEAVAVAPVPQANALCVADLTGCATLSLDNAGAIVPGQKVLVTGISQWTSHKVGLKDGHAQIIEPQTSDYPEPVLLAQPLPWKEDLKWVEIEGEIQRPHAVEGGTSFDLRDQGSSVLVRLDRADNASQLPSPGTRVLVRGLCLGGFNERGQWVAAQLWAAGSNAVALPGARSLSGQPSAKPPPPATPHSSDAATITSIEQIRRLTQNQLRTRPNLRIRAVVTDQHEGFVQDDTGGIETAFPPDEKRKLTEFGAYIEISGGADLDELGSPRIAADHVRVLGRGKLPQPRQASLSQLINGRIDGQWIEIEGVVRSTDGSHLLIICSGQELMATLTEAPIRLVTELVDAGVRVRGVGVTARDAQGRIQGTHLLVPSLEYVDVTTPPPDPAKLPIRKIGNLLGLSGPLDTYHRVKVEGIVTLDDSGKVFLQDDTGSATAVLKENITLDARFGRSRWLYWKTPQGQPESRAAKSIAPGERVQAVGFPETHRYSPVLTEATLTRVGSGAVPGPVPLSVDGIEQGALDSSLVTFDGVLRGQNTVGANSFLALEWQDRTLAVIVPADQLAFPKITPGSYVRITGVCQIDPAPYAELGLGVGAVRIQARSPGDIRVLALPSQWTVRRALMVVGGMAFIILAALVWIKVLRRQVAAGARQLAAEIQRREQTERRHALAQERARIAKDLHDDLGANLTRIVFLSNRVGGARQEGLEADRWFDLIPATARRTIQSLDEIVWAINPRHDSLESLANYLSQFAQELLSLAQVRCVLDVPTVLPPLPLSAEVRHNLLLTTREALQNAVKHATATEVRLTLKYDEAGLSIEIVDNGKGFDPASVSKNGNGLHNMRHRLKTIGGEMKITSRPGGGAAVWLFVPQRLLHIRVIGGEETLAQ